jgi:hypothetical protein
MDSQVNDNALLKSFSFGRMKPKKKLKSRPIRIDGSRIQRFSLPETCVTYPQTSILLID